MGFFIKKIIQLIITHWHSPNHDYLYSSINDAASEGTVEPHRCLKYSESVELLELSKILAASKPSTYILDPTSSKFPWRVPSEYCILSFSYQTQS